MDSDKENDDYERSLPDKVLEYYQQHALNPELPKYFLGTTIACNTQTPACSSKGTSPRDITHDTIKFRYELESPDSDKDNEGKESSINLNEDNESKMLSPTSSIASNKKLEWDNGADIGYDNCHKLIPRQRSASFPNLYYNTRCYDIAKKHVQSYFLKQDQSDDGVEEITMNTVETAVKSISGGKESSGSSRSTKSEKLITDSSTSQTPGIPSCTSSQTNEANIDIHKYISSSTNSNLSSDKQFTDTLAYILQKIGVPASQSTPKDDESKQIYIDTPILKGSLKPHRKLTTNDYMKNEVTSAEQAKEIAITKPNNNVLKSLSDSENGNCRTKFQYKENEFESNRKDGISDCSRKLESGGIKSYVNTEIKPVDIERISNSSKNSQHNELKPTIKKKSKVSSDSSSCSGKLERSCKNHDICTKLMKINKRINLCKTKPIFIECVDFEKKQCADKDSQTTFLQKDTGSKCIQTDNRTSPEDVIKLPSETKRLKAPIDVQKVVYLQHSDIQNQSNTKSSDTQTDTDGQISRSRSFEYLKGSTPTQTPKEIGTEKSTKVGNVTEKDKGKSKSDITLKDESDSSSVHEHLLTELLSINYSKDMTVDLEHTITILQKLLKSRKYDELTKRYYIKKVVRKIVESRYTDDSTTSSEFFRPKKSSFQLKEVNANVNIIAHSSEHSSNDATIDKQKANLMDNLPWYPANREYKQVTSSRKKLSKLSCKVTRTEIIPDVKEKILLKQTSKDDHDIRKPSIINKAKEVLQKQKQLAAARRESNRIRRSPSSFESNTPRSQSPEITCKPTESPEETPRFNETQSSEDKRMRNQSKSRQEPQDFNKPPVEKIFEQYVHQSRAIPTTQITKMTKDWKEQKTFSEMLLENKNKPTLIRRAGQGDYLVHLAKTERRHQLSWITNEIDHLQKLKGLLEKNPKIDRTRKAALTEALEKLYVKDMKGISTNAQVFMVSHQGIRFSVDDGSPPTERGSSENKPADECACEEPSNTETDSVNSNIICSSSGESRRSRRSSKRPSGSGRRSDIRTCRLCGYIIDALEPSRTICDTCRTQCECSKVKFCNPIATADCPQEFNFIPKKPALVGCGKYSKMGDDKFCTPAVEKCVQIGTKTPHLKAAVSQTKNLRCINKKLQCISPRKSKTTETCKYSTNRSDVAFGDETKEPCPIPECPLIVQTAAIRTPLAPCRTNSNMDSINSTPATCVRPLMVSCSTNCVPRVICDPPPVSPASQRSNPRRNSDPDPVCFPTSRKFCEPRPDYPPSPSTPRKCYESPSDSFIPPPGSSRNPCESPSDSSLSPPSSPRRICCPPPKSSLPPPSKPRRICDPTPICLPLPPCEPKKYGDPVPSDPKPVPSRNDSVRSTVTVCSTENIYYSEPANSEESICFPKNVRSTGTVCSETKISETKTVPKVVCDLGTTCDLPVCETKTVVKPVQKVVCDLGTTCDLPVCKAIPLSSPKRVSGSETVSPKPVSDAGTICSKLVCKLATVCEQAEVRVCDVGTVCSQRPVGPEPENFGPKKASTAEKRTQASNSQTVCIKTFILKDDSECFSCPGTDKAIQICTSPALNNPVICVTETTYEQLGDNATKQCQVTTCTDMMCQANIDSPKIYICAKPVCPEVTSPSKPISKKPQPVCPRPPSPPDRTSPVYSRAPSPSDRPSPVSNRASSPCRPVCPVCGSPDCPKIQTYICPRPVCPEVTYPPKSVYKKPQPVCPRPPSPCPPSPICSRPPSPSDRPSTVSNRAVSPCDRPSPVRSRSPSPSRPVCPICGSPDCPKIQTYVCPRPVCPEVAYPPKPVYKKPQPVCPRPPSPCPPTCSRPHSPSDRPSPVSNRAPSPYDRPSPVRSRSPSPSSPVCPVCGSPDCPKIQPVCPKPVSPKSVCPKPVSPKLVCPVCRSSECPNIKPVRPPPTCPVCRNPDCPNIPKPVSPNPVCPSPPVCPRPVCPSQPVSQKRPCPCTPVSQRPPSSTPPVCQRPPCSSPPVCQRPPSSSPPVCQRPPSSSPPVCPRPVCPGTPTQTRPPPICCSRVPPSGGDPICIPCGNTGCQCGICNEMMCQTCTIPKSRSESNTSVRSSISEDTVTCPFDDSDMSSTIFNRGSIECNIECDSEKVNLLSKKVNFVSEKVLLAPKKDSRKSKGKCKRGKTTSLPQLFSLGEKKVCASVCPNAEASAVQTCPALGCPKAIQVCGCRREKESQTKPPCACIPQGSQSRYQTENSTQAEDGASVNRSMQAAPSERRNSVSSTKSQNDKKEKKSKRKDKNRKASKEKEDKENGDKENGYKENGDKENEDVEYEDEENEDKSDSPKTLRGACGDAEPCKCTQTHEPKVTQCPATRPCTLSCQTCCTTEDVMCGCDSPSPEDEEVEQLMDCVCCKRRNVTIPRLQNLCNRLNLPPLCYPCYTLNEKSFYPYGYNNPSHQCLCYTMVDNGTIDAIQRTVTDLHKLEACEQYCSVLKDCQTCCVCGHKAKLPERFKNGVAYFLRVEDSCPVSVCKEKPPPKPCGTLDEVKIKVPCNTCPDQSKKCGCGDGGCKPTLQDYLCQNRPCFVKSAEMRRTTVLSAVCEREADKDERKLKFLDEQNKPKRYESPVSVYYSAVQEHSPFKSRKVGPRLFSEEEMKKMTERNYKRMSGYKQKEENEKQRKLKVSNRIIADTFSKRLQRYVLKGKRNLPTDVPVVSY